MLPGSPIQYLVPPGTPPETREAYIKLLGLDKPLYERFILYIKGVFTGNFGISYRYRREVLGIIWSRTPATVLLMGSSLILAIMIAFPLGILSGKEPGSKKDHTASVFSLIGYSMPAFWLGLMLIIFLSKVPPYGLGLFPVSGMHDERREYTGAMGYLDVIHHLILPMLTITIISIAGFSLFVRSSMIDVISQDYIMTARAKGLREYAVIHKHALKNALLPTVTLIGLSVGQILAGAIMTETVFNWPGLGTLTVEAAFFGDHPILLAFFILFAIVVIIVNILTDVAYALLDPRISYD